MRRHAWLLGFCLIASVAACGNSTTPPGGVDAAGSAADAAGSAADAATADASPTAADARRHDAPPSPYASQVMAFTCAPDDGPALRLLLADSVDANTCRQDGFGPSLEIYLWLSPDSITAPQTITFSSGDANGSATHCLGGAAPCLLFDQGEVTFDTYENGVSGSGTYKLMQGDTLEEGTFDVTWCEPATPELCG